MLNNVDKQKQGSGGAGETNCPYCFALRALGVPTIYSLLEDSDDFSHR